MRRLWERSKTRRAYAAPLADGVVLAHIVAFAGLFAAGVLSAGHLLDLPVPCGHSRGCVTVALHPSSKLFGVPIAYFGVGAYITMLILLGQVQQRWARWVFLAVPAFGTVTSGLLLYYSQTVIHATCPWCIASGMAMLLLFLLGLWLLRHGEASRTIGPALFWSLAITTALGIGVEAGLMDRVSKRPPVSSAKLRESSLAELVDHAKMLGPSNAPVTVIMFGDLWCPACRAVHGSLVKYQESYPNEVRLVFRHRPLEGLRGHESSGAAAALSEIAAEDGKFWPFLQAIYSLPRQPDRNGYLKLLKSFDLDSEAAEQRIANGEDRAVQRVRDDMNLADKLGISATPTFIVHVEGRPLTSANQRTLPEVLNSATLQGAVLTSRERLVD